MAFPMLAGTIAMNAGDFADTWFIGLWIPLSFAGRLISDPVVAQGECRHGSQLQCLIKPIFLSGADKSAASGFFGNCRLRAIILQEVHKTEDQDARIQ